MRVADAIFKRLAKETSAVYYVPGGGSMYLVDALGRSNIKAISAVHEQGAGLMALGHAMTRGLGVCLTTSGPGASNAMTACLAAWTDSIPVLFISGQARTEQLEANKGTRTKGLQHFDVISSVKHITKMAYEPVTSAHDCLIALDKMIQECKDGRKGPCWLSVPQDIQGMEM